LTACINLFHVGKNVLSDKATMSKNKYVSLWLKCCTSLPFFVCLNTWFLFLDISLCALLISQPTYLYITCVTFCEIVRGPVIFQPMI
jgi:hypothetical protein